MTAQLTGGLVHTAQADAWQEHGRLRRATGGDRADLPGVRLMASGLPYAWWNTADVLDAGRADVDAVRDWYAARDLPWGVRVPAGTAWPHGRHLLHQRLMGQTPDGFRPTPPARGTTVRVARPADLDAVVAVDTAAFDADPAASRAWLAPLLDDAAVTVVVALSVPGQLGDLRDTSDPVRPVPVGTAYAVRSDGRAGPAVLLAGVAVVPRARRRGVASAMSSMLLRDGYDRGARLGHLQPDTPAAAAVYAGLGFVEVGGVDVHAGADEPGEPPPVG